MLRSGPCSRATSTSWPREPRSSGTSATIDLSADARAWPRSPTRGDGAPRGLLRGRGGRRRAPRTFSPTARPRRASTRSSATRSATRGSSPATRRPSGLDDPRAHVSRAFLELFERRLPEAAAGAPGEAVGVYHMVLEGVVFTAGPARAARPRRRPAARPARRARSWCCATSAGTSASAPAAWPTLDYDEAGDPRRGRARGGAVGARVGRARDGWAAPPAARGRPAAALSVNLETEELAGAEPALVFLHEGLGSVALWRDFPARLAAATGRRALIYSRAGHGQSDVPDAPRRRASCTRRRSTCSRRCCEDAGIERPVLVGHSDGGSIALIHASAAPGQRARPARAARLRRGRLGGEHRGGARDVRDHRPGRAHGPLPPRRRAHLPALERHLARARVPRLEHRGRAGGRDRADAGDPGRARPVRDAGADRRDRARRQRSGRRAWCSTAGTRRTSRRRRRPCERRRRSCD